MIKHHLNDATLMSYAAGSLPEALCAVVAAHVSKCPSCAKKAWELELVGSLLFEALEPVALNSQPSAQAVSDLTSSADMSSTLVPEYFANREIEFNPNSEVPATIFPFIGDDLDEVAWKRLGFGIWHAQIGPETEGRRGDLRLIKVAPGKVLPDHSHGGTELTMVLRGSYKDEIATFSVGDVEDVDGDTEHQPVSDAKNGCICLIASESPAQYRNIVARLVQPLTGL